MTTTTATTPHTPGALSTGTVAGLGLATCLVATAATMYGAHDWGEIATVVAAIVIVGAVAFGLVVPRALRKESAGGTALGLSVPAILLMVPAFWSGLPLVLGVAGLVVGSAGRHAPRGAGKSIAAIVLGALAAVGYLAVYVSDAFNGGGGFLFD